MSNATLRPPTSSTPTVPTSFSTDVYIDTFVEFPNGTVIPGGNNIIITGGATGLDGSTLTDNRFGIQTAADPNNGKILIIELTNRISDQGFVAAMSTDNLVIFALDAIPRAYRFNFDVITINQSQQVCGYNLQATFKTNGTTASLVQDLYVDSDEDVNTCNLTMVGSANNVQLNFTNGTADIMAFKLVGTYIKV